MKLKTLFFITAIFFAINAPIAVVFPAVQLSLYGVSTGPAQNYMAQWAGLGSVVVALVAWFARNLAEGKARDSAALTLLIYFLFSFGISVSGIVSGVMSVIGWPLAGICLLFASGYGYFLLKKPGI